jgi:hypothetical protein
MSYSLKKITTSAKPRHIVVIFVIMAVGLATILISRAASLSSSFQAEGGARSSKVALVSDTIASGGSAIKFSSNVASCGKQVQNYSYQVPFGNAVWNQPVCGLPRHPRTADYANRFYQWGHINDGSPAADTANGKIRNDPGYPDATQINPLGAMFTREVYYASKSTTESRIGTVSYYSNLDGENVNTFTPDAKIPWNPSWEASQGGDNEMIILDDRPGPTQGRIYYLSGYYPSYPVFPYRKIPPVGCQVYFQQNRLCTYTTTVARDLQGNYVDYRTYEGYVSDRGVGLSYLATLVTPEEVEAKEIRHAVGIAMPNTSYGPICTKAQQGTSAEGLSCGTAVAPASKFEHADKTSIQGTTDGSLKTLYTLDKTVPEGMRFAIDITYDQIDAWVNSRTDLNATRKNTARIFARALKDYGMIVADTNGGSPSIQQAGGINPDNAAKWTALGMGPDEKDTLLNGLITSTNLYVVNPPTVTCKDGLASKYFCQWTSARYP